MWHGLVRGIVFIVFWIAFVMGSKRRVRKRSGRNRMALAVTALAMVMLSLGRIENVFYSFPTAESVAEYVCGDHVLNIIDGKNSSLIVYSDDEGVIKMMITPRQKSGYKIGSDFHKKTISSDYTHGYLVDILRYKDVEDCYITIIGIFNTPEISVEDNCNSKFVESKEENVFGNVEFTDYMALAFIEEYTEGYTVTITIGGESMTLSL